MRTTIVPEETSTDQGQPLRTEQQDSLRRVLESASMQAAPRQRQFLQFVAEETLAGRGDDLKAWTIARHALEQPVTFDPTSDPLVRVVAYRLRESLDSYYSGPGALDPVRIELPKGRYQPRFTYANTDDGRPLKRSRTVGPTVAVASFSDQMSGDHPRYLPAGLTESVAGALAGQPTVEVIGPVTLPDSEDLDAAIAQGRKLEADLILLGSVRSGAAGAVRLTARLVDVASSILVWGGSFDARPEEGDAFDLEDQFAARLAIVLGDHLGVVARSRTVPPRTTNPDVYHAILAYYAYARSLDQTEQPEVQAALERALALEPDNDLVLSMLASLLMFQGVGDASGTPPSAEMHERSLELARRARHVEPSQELAAAVLAFGMLVDGDDTGALAALTDILAVATSPSVRSWCAVGLALSGAWDEGIAELHVMLSLNPDHPSWQRGFLALDALAHGDAVTALAEAQRVETPGLVWGPLLRAAAYGAMGDLEAGAAQLERLGEVSSTATANDRFLSHMRLPEHVALALAEALGAITASA